MMNQGLLQTQDMIFQSFNKPTTTNRLGEGKKP